MEKIITIVAKLMRLKIFRLITKIPKYPTVWIIATRIIKFNDERWTNLKIDPNVIMERKPYKE